MASVRDKRFRPLGTCEPSAVPDAPPAESLAEGGEETTNAVPDATFTDAPRPAAPFALLTPARPTDAAQPAQNLTLGDAGPARAPISFRVSEGPLNLPAFVPDRSPPDPGVTPIPKGFYIDTSVYLTPPPTTREDVEHLRETMLKDAERTTGPIPPLPSEVRVGIVSREHMPRAGGYTLTKFELENGEGMTVPGYLLLPDAAGEKNPVPLLVFSHATDEHGKDEIYVYGQTGWPEHTTERLAEVLVSPGYAVVIIDQLGFGERRGQLGTFDRHTDELQAIDAYYGARGATRVARMVADSQLAIEFALSQPGVDPTRVGAMGFSMGEGMSQNLPLRDERIDPIATFGGFEIERAGYAAAIAPRRQLVQSGSLDHQMAPADGLVSGPPLIKSVYGVFGAADRYQNLVDEGLGHSYTIAQLDRALEVFAEAWAANDGDKPADTATTAT